MVGSEGDANRPLLLCILLNISAAAAAAAAGTSLDIDRTTATEHATKSAIPVY